MGFGRFSSPYDWSRITAFKQTAQAVPGGMVDLSVGSPVDPVPEVVQSALTAHADASDAHGYPVTRGSGALRSAVTAWFQKNRNVDLDGMGAGFVPTVGSKEAVALMASLLHLGVGDVVVQPRVSYPTYEIGTQLAGAQTLKVGDVADVESWVHVPGVRAVWVNSPCNPTGEVLSTIQLAGVVKAARSIGAVVLSDECYALFTWDDAVVSRSNELAGNRPAAPCVLDDEVCGGSANGVLALYSLSKQSNMAGYRTALIAGDADLIAEQAAYRKQIGQIIPGAVQAAMAAALGAQGTAAVAQQRSRYQARLERLMEALREYGYDASMPQGALYVWVKTLSGDCWSDMERLASLGIVPSPGEFYGAPDYLRFSSTATDEAIDLAASRLASA